jgi:hypothetical protein
MEIAMGKSLQETLAHRLCDSVERLQRQAQNVEFWASAISGLSQPVPDYEPEATPVARYLKPPRPTRKRRRRRAANQNNKADAKPASA